jgi:hypothetical protein
LTIQQSRGDETIAEELARLPAFAIATTNTSTTASTTTEPTNGSVQVPDGDISTLLTVNDVAGLAGSVGLSTKQIDMRAMAENVDPTPVEHMISFDSLSFVAADRTQGLTLTTIKFDSEEADNHMALLALEASTMQDFADTIGDESGSLEVNEGGFGSIVVFKKGVWVIQLHTAQRSGVNPLLDLAGVEAASRLIADQL